MTRLLITLMFGGCLLCPAGTIDSYTTGNYQGSGIFEESFTTPAGGPWTNITFNFFSDSAGTTPTAAGTAYLLGQAYFGTPTALSGATNGFLASSTGISGGIYIFDSSVDLLPNTQYWIATNAAVSTYFSDTPYSGGHFYQALNPFYGFAPQAQGAVDFSLNGQAEAAPEPACAALGFAGLGALAVIIRRRRSHTTL